MILRERQYISIGKVAKLIGVSVVTLRRWDKKGLFKSCFRTFGSHRRYNIYKMREQFLKENNNKIVCYARVSSSDQKNDLKTQVEKLKKYCINNDLENVEVIEDVGSGLNFNKKGFKKLFTMIINQQLNHLVINHQDRLLRFCAELIFKLCDFYKIKKA